MSGDDVRAFATRLHDHGEAYETAADISAHTGASDPHTGYLLESAYGGSGTSFPGSPSSGDRYFRTDIRGGMWFKWNGTYWLSEQMFIAHDDTYALAANNEPYVCALPTDLDVYVVSCDIKALVGSPNDGSNYWIISLRKLLMNNSATGLVAPNTSAISHSTWSDFSSLAVNTLVETGTSATDAHSLTAYHAKSGSPGVLFTSLSATYRLRAT